MNGSTSLLPLLYLPGYVKNMSEHLHTPHGNSLPGHHHHCSGVRIKTIFISLVQTVQS